MDSEFLSTGEVARLCGVTRDAVVKWIKKGKLPAVQTPGGHYRVARKVCDTLSAKGSGTPYHGPLYGSPLPEGPDVPQLPKDPDSMRCWEYFGEAGAPRETCKGCLVYLARAQKCYRLAELGEESGHRLHFCRNECRTCAYYRACQGLATEVLIVTRDEALSHRLLMGADPESVSIRFARSGYESSAIISTFSPALIILDSGLAEVRNGQLPTSMLADDRIPGSRVAVALREGDQVPLGDAKIPTLRAPFTAKQVQELAEEAAGPVAQAPRGVA